MLGMWWLKYGLSYVGKYLERGDKMADVIQYRLMEWTDWQTTKKGMSVKFLVSNTEIEIQFHKYCLNLTCLSSNLNELKLEC